MLPGPMCSWHLTGLGASVDRVESLYGGDMTRAVPPVVDGTGAFYGALNRGARSIAVDLRHEGGRAALRALIPHYDVLIEGFRPGILEAMGLDPETLFSLNNDLIVARISGFGQTGPWAQRAGHDINYVGIAGVPNLGPGVPVPPVQVADAAGGMVAAMRICAALVGRDAASGGQILDISLAEAALGVVSPHLTSLSHEGRDASAGGEFLTGGLPIYSIYQCSDGKHLAVGALEPKFQECLIEEFGGVDKETLTAGFLTNSREYWVDHLDEACVAPCLGATEISEHPQHRFRDVVREMGGGTYVRPPGASSEWYDGTVPGLGEHTFEALKEAGVTDSVYAAWKNGGGVL